MKIQMDNLVFSTVAQKIIQEETTKVGISRTKTKVYKAQANLGLILMNSYYGPHKMHKQMPN